MYTVSDKYKAKIKEASRTFSIKVTIGDASYTNSDISGITLEGNIQPQQGFTIGNTTSRMLKITFINKDTLKINATKLNLLVGVLLDDGTYEYIPFKNYNIDKKETNDFTTSITCYDNMILLEKKYNCSLTFPAQLSDLVNDILSGTGISCNTSLSNIKIPSNISGKTKREWIGYIASYLGCNAIINRDGNLEFKLLNDISKSYNIKNGIFNLTKEQEEFKIEAIECTANNSDIISGSSDETASVTKFTNPWIDKARLDTISSNLIKIKYLGYTMTWQGDPALDIGDIITFTDKKGNEIVSPILNYKINLAGVTAEMSAKGETVLRNNTETIGTQQKQINEIRQNAVTTDYVDSAVDTAIENKDLVTNTDLDTKLEDYATNDDLSDYVTNDDFQQQLVKNGENLLLNGDFNNYRYNPDGIDSCSDKRIKWQIMKWNINEISRQTINMRIEKTAGVDGGCCFYMPGGYGQQFAQTVLLENVEGDYLLIECLGKRPDEVDLNYEYDVFCFFYPDYETKTDMYGEQYFQVKGNYLNTNWGDAHITPTKSSKYEGWWQYKKVIKIPDGAKCVLVGTCANDNEFYWDKVSVKAQTDGSGYEENKQDEKDRRDLGIKTITFKDSDWTTIASGGSSYGSKASKSLSLNNTLSSTNINCSFINDDANCREFVNWSATASKITIYNDRTFNGHVVMQCFDR